MISWRKRTKPYGKQLRYFSLFIMSIQRNTHSYAIIDFILKLINDKSLHIRDLVDEVIQLINQSGKKIGKEIIHEFNLDKQLPLVAEREIIIEKASKYFLHRQF